MTTLIDKRKQKPFWLVSSGAKYDPAAEITVERIWYALKWGLVWGTIIAAAVFGGMAL